MDKRRRVYGKTMTPPSVITVDQSSDNPNAVTVTNGSTVYSLLDQFRRCLCKKTSNKNVSICYLNDSNSNYYHDGTSADLTGSEGDVMVYFPEMYYKCTSDTTYMNIYISNYEIEGYNHVPASLVGAYLAKYEWLGSSGPFLFSKSGVIPSSVSYNSFVSYASGRGSGYHIMDYMQHRIIAWMFLARYWTRNSQSKCGMGNHVTTNGSTNSRGIKDTTTTNTSLAVNFLGLENCWGHSYEFIQGIHSSSGIIAYDKGDWEGHDYSSLVNTYKVPNVRLLNDNSYGIYRGITTTMWGGKYGDLVMKTYNSGSSAYNYYWCDEGAVRYIGGTCAVRSGYNGSNESGVFYLDVEYYANDENDNLVSSRLAFDGNITEVKDVSTFKNLPVL